MAKPIVQRLKETNPQLKFVFSFFSPSGYENIDVNAEDTIKIYLPLDTPRNGQDIIQLINPAFVLFIKYDFWFNFLDALKKARVPYYFASIHLNATSYLFGKPFSSFLMTLKNATCLYCHNANSKEIFSSHGFTNCEVLGDTRIDQVLQNKTVDIAPVNWKHDRPIIIYGSVCPEDEVMITQYVNKYEEYNHIIVPHDVNKETLEKIERQIEKPLHRHSVHSDEIDSILIVDTLGDLKYLYRFADIAYIGGGFSKGPHNILEAMIYGTPVCCGPNIKKFPMAQQLEKENLLWRIKEKKNFAATLNEMLKTDIKSYQEKAHEYVDSNKSNLNDLIQDLNRHLV